MTDYAPKKDLEDFVKAHIPDLIKAWADKMKREGGEHPFSWCLAKAKKFSDDPEAFCASVYQEAYGMMPVERKAKKGEK